MVRRLSFFLIAINFFGVLLGQEWTFILKQDVGQKITAVDIGTLGKYFVGTERGNVYSFHQDGSRDKHFSSAIFQPITDIDASNSLRIFVFYKSANQFEYLDRFTALPRTYQLEDFGLLRADHAALDADGTIWFLSGSTLFHVIVFNYSILSEQMLPNRLIDDVITDMAVDHHIILSNRQDGISTWDGSRLTAEVWSGAGVRAFHLSGDELVALTTSEVLIRNLRTGGVGRFSPPRHDFTQVLKAGNVFAFIRGSEIFWYRLNE